MRGKVKKEITMHLAFKINPTGQSQDAFLIYSHEKNSSLVQSVSSYIKPKIQICNSDILIDTASPVRLQFWREREIVFSTYTVVHTN